jgi:2-oxoisovalerate dehydrogenase E1 component
MTLARSLEHRNTAPLQPEANGVDAFDWAHVTYLLQVSRALDALEEKILVPEKKVLYQFSARGHDMAQIMLGSLLTNRHDAACGYYRSRPLLLALGVDMADALGSSMARAGGYSDGRDIGVVFNYPNPGGPAALPMCGGVGAQYTPTAGWAQAIDYRSRQLKDAEYDSAISVVLGGDGSVATNGFWSALTIATTQKLPMLFYIEDNGYGISVPSTFQTPGGDIAANLAAFQNLLVLSGDGCNPAESAGLISQAVAHVRQHQGPCLLRLTVPRLEGHSFQDTQTYKTPDFIKHEWARDPLNKLRDFLVPQRISTAQWDALQAQAEGAVEQAREQAEARPASDPAQVTRHVFFEGDMQLRGGQWSQGYQAPVGSSTPQPEGQRLNMVAAIRKTLDVELANNPRVLLFGEDIGPKGGVHAVTLGLQEKYGERRVFDTSLSEEGIIGRAVGMALAGLMPVPEIQFRKYADPALEQLNDCGTLRWRTHNRFGAPMVVRIAGGFFKCGDPWHSQTNEVQFVHSPGWKVAVPSNAEDAVGLLRAALRGNDPVIFFEHRAMLDAASARRPYPGDDYVLAFGKARTVCAGSDLTIVTWGAMVERCEQAAEGRSVDVLDLRTLMPWDREAVLASVRRTHRCLIVHEDLGTAGFGAEIAAVVAEHAFAELDAPVARLTMPDIPSPHHPSLMEHVLPSVQAIAAKIDELVGY